MIPPEISIVIPVYNTEHFLEKSINSILHQSFDNYEIIFVNDNSTDGSLEIIQSFKSSKIKIINNERNYGPAYSRNVGNTIAQGKYICVLDSDDYCSKNRLEIQYNFMEENPEITLCAGGFIYNGRKIYKESDYHRIKVILLRQCYLKNSTVFYRKDDIDKYTINYNENLTFADDYDFQCRVAKSLYLTNIYQILCEQNSHSGQLTQSKSSEQERDADEVRINQLENFKITPTNFQREVHLNLIKSNPIPPKYKQESYDWIERLLKANKKLKEYDENYLEDFFESLIYNQPFFSNDNYILPPRRKLLDLTIILTIDSRKENAYNESKIAINYLVTNFETNIIVLDSAISLDEKILNEVDLYELNSYQLISEINDTPEFMKDIKTQFVFYLDPIFIIPIEHIFESMNLLRNYNYDAIFPFNGCVYTLDLQLIKLFSDKYRLNCTRKELMIYKKKKLNRIDKIDLVILNKEIILKKYKSLSSGLIHQLTPITSKEFINYRDYRTNRIPYEAYQLN